MNSVHTHTHTHKNTHTHTHRRCVVDANSRVLSIFVFSSFFFTHEHIGDAWLKQIVGFSSFFVLVNSCFFRTKKTHRGCVVEAESVSNTLATH
jgi:hypothetical protein